MNPIESLERLFGSRIKKNVPLAPLTTIGVGGRAEFYFEPCCIRELIIVRKIGCETGLTLRIFGGGSNVILDDNHMKGLVISTHSLSGFNVSHEDHHIYVKVESGVPLKRLIALSVKEGFAGFEFAVGIPGTMGGALCGNAGVKDHSVSDIVRWVETIDSEGVITRRNKNEIHWDYRYSGLCDQDCYISQCCLDLVLSSRQDVRSAVKSFWQRRVHQPYGFKSAGCIFKNPDGDSAGRLLDLAGCKGLRKGDAVVSHFHANFIINYGEASFEDMVGLIRECKRRVKDFSGIDLSLEVKIISDTQVEI